MHELQQAISGAHEIAVASVGTFLLGLLWLLLRPQPARVRMSRLALPFVLLVVYLTTDLVLEAWRLPRSVRNAARLVAMFALLLAYGRLLSVLLLDWLVGRRFRRETPRIVREVVEGTLLVVALLITLRSAGVDATSILATSALLTAIIGLSLQDTLGNLFAGLALQAQRTFGVGEWIQSDRDGIQLGEVVEINWRATRVRTSDRVELTIPNAQLARSPIFNFSRPLRVVRRAVIVSVPYEVPTARVCSVLQNAVAHVPGVLGVPEPMVVTHNFVDVGVQYAVYYCIEDFERRFVLDGQVRDRVWSALSRAGIPISATVHAPTPSAAESALDERKQALRTVDFLRDLPDDALQQLTTAARSERYDPGEIVVRQGERGDELYLCRTGELVVLHSGSDGVRREIARLSAGSMFGELAQMSGEPRRATVQAVTACDLIVVGKPAFAQVLTRDPALAELMSQRMAERAAALDDLGRNATPEEQRDSVSLHKGHFLRRIRELFALS